MVRLAPPAERVAHRAIETILEKLLSDGQPLPSCVLVDDGAGEWRRHAALLPVEERRSTVVAALSEACLIDAVRFEIGGALWLPASLASMEIACESAAQARRPGTAPVATRGMVEAVIAEAERLSAVGWWPQPFWNSILGTRRPLDCLTGVADRLGRVACVLPGPVLLVADRDRLEIETARDEEVARDGSTVQVPPAIVDLSESLGSAHTKASVENVLASVFGEMCGDVEASAVVLPVFELPGGGRVGGWSSSPAARADGAGWLATPVEDDRVGGQWQLVGEGGSREIVADSISPPDELPATQSVIRVPGRLGAELHFGSPAALLVEKAARDGRRAGRPVWVPNVDTVGVAFLLTLPGPIWVDGSGVPG